MPSIEPNDSNKQPETQGAVLQSFCLDCFIIFGNHTVDFATVTTFEYSVQSLTICTPTPKISNINFNSAVEEVKV